jgi:hypothetical protein
VASQHTSSPRFRIQLLDAAALVVGFGLAAVLFRAFWPGSSVSPGLAFFAVALYLWLGLAMSGPLLLLKHRHAAADIQPGQDVHRADHATGRTWAEMAWLMIGVYWIVMGVFVLPIRLQSFRFGDTVLFGLVPLACGLIFRLFGPRLASGGSASTPWTHHAAVALLVTWPIAWVCLMVVGQAVL